MSKFDILYRTLETNLKIDPTLVGEAGEQPPAQQQQDVQPQVPNPQEVAQQPTPEAVTSEGKKFLIELALKALAVDPDNITTTDKDIFNTQITNENADGILKRLQSIVDLYG